MDSNALWQTHASNAVLRIMGTNLLEHSLQQYNELIADATPPSSMALRGSAAMLWPAATERDLAILPTSGSRRPSTGVAMCRIQTCQEMPACLHTCQRKHNRQPIRRRKSRTSECPSILQVAATTITMCWMSMRRCQRPSPLPNRSQQSTTRRRR